MSMKLNTVGVEPKRSDAGSIHTLLVVDDDERIVEAFSTILAQDGYRILSAATGTEAWEIVQNEEVALVVCDVRLPDISGIETCRRIKTMLEGAYIPVILMTGMTARDMRLEGLDAGADDFLDKPIELVELTARVRAHLRTKRLHDELEAHRRELELRVEERTLELKEAYQRLQTMSKVKGNILSIVAHELRTPLLHARSYLDLAVQTELDTQKRVELIKSASGAMLELEYRVGDVEVLNDPSDLKLAGTSIHAIAARSVDQTVRHYPEAKDRVEMDVRKGLPPVLVDSSAIVRVLVHLLENGIKFADTSQVKLSVIDVPGGVEVVVQDQGPGLPEEVRRTLFEPLQPGDLSSTRKHRGMGIGLALASVVLQAHGSEITVETGTGEGTKLSFILPVMTVEDDPLNATIST